MGPPSFTSTPGIGSVSANTPVIGHDSLNKHMGRDIITKTFKCESCGHFWRPTLWLLPKTCPKCKSLDWDKRNEGMRNRRDA
jgi:hypothetical protein